MEGIQNVESVSGFAFYLNGALVGCRSRSQNCVSLSQTEAAYAIVSDLAKEIVFAENVLDFIVIELQFHILVNVDNIGASNLAEYKIWFCDRFKLCH